MTVHNDLLSLIGQTPMVAAKRLDTGKCQLFFKMESQNPGGSIKDRIALEMIETAERDGRLKPGGTIIEATAGNTGLGLALIAAVKGYQLKIVLPDKMSKEKIAHLKAMGAEVVMTRSDVGKGHPEYYQDLAAELAKQIPGAFYINQFANPSNPEAHFKTTAPEIWQQLEGAVDAIVCGVGSSGTVTGLTRYIKENHLNTEIVLADPLGSVLTDYVQTGQFGRAGSWLVEGIGEDFIPTIADLSAVKKAYSVSDKDSFLAARELLKQEGIFAGSSTGTLLHAALTYCRAQTEPKRVVTFVGDSGNKYLSKCYDDFWMYDQGFLMRTQHGDLRDVMTRYHTDRAVVFVKPDEPLLSAHKRMTIHGISQLPVLAGEQLVGVIDEADLLRAVVTQTSAFATSVSEVMRSHFASIQYNSDRQQLVTLLDAQTMVAVMADTQFLGIITRIDLINFLRRDYLVALEKFE